MRVVIGEDHALMREGLTLRRAFGSGASYAITDGCLELTFSEPFNGYAFHLVNA